MFSFLNQMPYQRGPWLLLFVGGLSLEFCALYFQHVMKLDPCVMCVYERVAMLGLTLAGLFTCIAPNYLLFRLTGFALWIASAAWGLQLALTHTDYQMNPSPFATCDFFANFPDWFKLDQWFPWMFNPTGYCDEIAWMFLGWSMPQWLIAIFAGFLALGIVFFVLQWRKK
ncbi:disulfide bond formation protein DsbB [Agarivorans sp. QJM3NY_29]|uniref:disulfide bond formation protein DsbB n=1 Tax=unclassified Agarivorans TaxID=2636026 RepID=UPI003D7F1306